MFPARPTTDTLGPMTRTVRDAAILLDAIVGYDPKDQVTAYAVGHIPASYTSFLSSDGLKGARIGVIRQPMDEKTDVASEDYRKGRVVIDQAIRDLRRLGAEIVDPVGRDFSRRDRSTGESLRRQPIRDRARHQPVSRPACERSGQDTARNPSVGNGRAISGAGIDGQRRQVHGRFLAICRSLARRKKRVRVVIASMADKRLNAMVYATFDHQPAPIATDVMTRPVVEDVAGFGNNRRLSAVLGFPAMTLPAGFTADGIPVGIEFLGRPFAEPTLFKLGYASSRARITAGLLLRHRRSGATPRRRARPNPSFYSRRRRFRVRMRQPSLKRRSNWWPAWFGGTREGASDVGIWLSRREKNGWMSPIEVANGKQADGTRYPCWNPVLFALSDNVLMLFYKVGPSPQAWWGMVQTSQDAGRDVGERASIARRELAEGDSLSRVRTCCRFNRSTSSSARADFDTLQVDRRNPARVADGVERVRVEHEEVGRFARRDRAELIESEDVR